MDDLGRIPISPPDPLQQPFLTYTADSGLGPIGDTKIRLLRPLRSPHLPSEVPRLRLDEFNVSELPSYIALSYTWGPAEADGKERNEPSDLKPISVNSRRLNVYPNLYDALCQLAESDDDKCIWIDAICINQEDRREASEQVAIMDIIYKGASKTILWLGKETSHTARAVGVLARCASSARHAVLQRVGSGVWADPVNIADPAALDKYQIPRLSEDDWVALADVFGRRYFGRVWMTQEVALASQIEVRCGNLSFSWADIGNFSVFLFVTNCLPALLLSSNRPVSHIRICKGASYSIGLHVARLWCTGEDPDLLKVVQRFNWTVSMEDNLQSPGLALFKTLQLTSTFAATDTRDRVFSNYGIIKHMVPGADNSPYRPNYRLTEAEVFSHFFQALLRETGELNILTFAGDGYTTRVAGLPSWVPDFTVTRPTTIIGTGGPSEAISKLDASGELGRQHCTHLIDGPMLYVRAYEVGRVAACGETYGDMTTKCTLAEIAEMLFHLVAPVYPYTDQLRTEAFWRTLVLDQDMSSRPADVDVGRSFKAWFTLFLAARIRELLKKGVTLLEASMAYQKIDLIAMAEKPPGQFFPRWSETLSKAVHMGWIPAPPRSGLNKVEDLPAYLSSWLKEIRKFETIAFYVMNYRRTFVTNYGHIACGPMSTAVGDSVWIVAGCPCPLILRQTSNYDNNQPYRVIGETYVHGIMNGEAVSGEVEWNNICLC